MIQHSGSGALNISSSRYLNNSSGEVLTAGNFAIDTQAVDNNFGKIASINNNANTLSTLSGQLTLNNDLGEISSNHQLMISGFENVSNSNGLIRTANDADLSIKEISNLKNFSITNPSRPTGILSAGNLLIDAKKNIDNEGAKIAANNALKVTASTLNNSNGEILANRKVTINARDTLLNRQSSDIASINEDVNIESKEFSNNNSYISGEQSVNIKGGVYFDNSDGQINSKGDVTLTTNAQTLSNIKGKIVSGNILTINADQAVLDNTKGLLQQNSENTLVLDAKKIVNAQTLEGKTGIQAQGNIKLVTGSLDNTSGYIVSNKDISLFAPTIKNDNGEMLSANNIYINKNIDSDSLSNVNGTIYAKKDIDISLNNKDKTTTLINQSASGKGGLIEAGNNLSIMADNIINGSKQTVDIDSKAILKGKEVAINANNINNQQGVISAEENIHLISKIGIDNSAGLIQGKNIDINKSLQNTGLLLTNGSIKGISGKIIASNDISLNSNNLSSKGGEINAANNLDINLHDADKYIHTDETVLKAGNTLTFKTAGSFVNQSTLSANNVNLTAQSIENISNQSRIEGNLNTHLQANTLINKGLINGDETWLNIKDRIDNESGGRIYGTHLAINTGTLNNSPTSDAQDSTTKAPIIAARERLDIGANVINNLPRASRDGKFAADFEGQAKIFSAGSMTIGGDLNSDLEAIGQATALNNVGATIESIGDMKLLVKKINNANASYQIDTQLKEYSPEMVVQGIANGKTYNLKGDGYCDNHNNPTEACISWDRGDYYNGRLSQTETEKLENEDFSSSGGVNTFFVTNPSGWRQNGQGTTKWFDRISYTEITKEDQTLSSDPSRIVVGGDLIVNGDNFSNDKSQVIVGGDIDFIGKNLVTDPNKALGDRYISYEDSIIRQYSKDKNGKWLTEKENPKEDDVFKNAVDLAILSNGLTAQTLKNQNIANQSEDIAKGNVSANNVAMQQTKNATYDNYNENSGSNHTSVNNSGKLSQAETVKGVQSNTTIIEGKNDVGQAVKALLGNTQNSNNVTADTSGAKIKTSQTKTKGLQQLVLKTLENNNAIVDSSSATAYQSTNQTRTDGLQQLVLKILEQNSAIVDSSSSAVINQLSSQTKGSSSAKLGNTKDSVKINENVNTTSIQAYESASKDIQTLIINIVNTSGDVSTLPVEQQHLLFKLLSSNIATAEQIKSAGQNSIEHSQDDFDINSLKKMVDTLIRGDVNSTINQASTSTTINVISTAIDSEGSDNEVRTLNKDYVIPANAFYGISSDPNANYIVETDKDFTQQSKWLSSDYMLQQLNLDPNKTHKRLGDGFYEQQLIRDQVMALTSSRALNDYRDDTREYQQLMDQGVAFAKRYNLVPGVALSAEQMQQLTQDIVWLVEKTVTLSDGTQRKVLVPQLYAVRKVNSIKGDGSLITSNNFYAQLSGDVENNATISTSGQMSIDAKSITNNNRFDGDFISLKAKEDINNNSAIVAKRKLNIDAGGDVNIKSTVATSQANNESHSNSVTYIDRQASITVGNKDSSIISGDTLSITAGKNINANAANIQNYTGNTVLSAVDNINLNALNVGRSESHQFSDSDYRNTSYSKDIGSKLSSAGNLTLSANNIRGVAADIVASGKADFNARQDISLLNGTESYKNDSYSKSGRRDSHSESSTSIGSRLDAGQIGMQAGNDITLSNASLNAKTGIELEAGNNIAFNAVKNVNVNNFKDHNGIDNAAHSIDAGTTLKNQLGDIRITAGNNITGTATQINNEMGNTIVIADNDVTFNEGREETSSETSRSWTKKKFYGKKKYTENESTYTNTAVTSDITGRNVIVSSNKGNVSLVGTNVDAIEAAEVTAMQGKVTVQSAVDQASKSTVRTTSNFYKGTGQQKGYERETLNETGISGASVYVNGKNVAVNAASLQAKDGNLQVGDASLATDAQGNLKLDENGKPIVQAGSIDNLTFGTIELEDKKWNNKQKSYKGIAKIGMQVAGVVGGALGVTDGITISKSSEDTSSNTREVVSNLEGNNILVGGKTVKADGTTFKTTQAGGSTFVLGNDIDLGVATTTSTNTQRRQEETIGGEGIKLNSDSLQLGAVVRTDSDDKTTTTKSSHQGVTIDSDHITVLGDMTDGSLTTKTAKFNANEETGSLLIGAKTTNLGGIENTETVTNNNKTDTTRLSVDVHHASADLAVAAEQVKDAGSAVAAAKNELSDAKDRASLGELSADAVKDYEINLAAATLNLANAQINLGSTAASAANTAPTAGFSATAKAEHTRTTSTDTQSKGEWQGTELNGANATFVGDDFTGVGLKGNIGQLNIDNLGSFTLKAGTNTSSGSSTSKTSSQTGSISTTGSASLGISQQQSSAQSQGNTYTNSELNVGEFNGYADTTNLTGGRINAGGGSYATDTLNIETAQNSASSSDKSSGGNIGINFAGGAPSGGSIGANKANGNSQSLIAAEQSGIVYNDDNHRLTANNTTNIGGIVANINTDNDGNQTNGTLNFTTGSLTTKDLINTATEEQRSIGGSLSVGSTPTGKSLNNVGIQLGHTGRDFESVTKATIGQGAIVTGDTLTGKDSLASVNRDALNTETIIKDVQTGGLAVNTGIDTRVLTSKGRDEIIKEQKELGKNVKTTGKITAAAGIQGVATAGNIITGNQNISQAIQGAKTPSQMAKVIQDHPEVGAVLQSYQQGDYDGLLNSQNALQILSDSTGVSVDVIITSLTNQLRAKGATDGQIVAIDSDASNRKDVIKTTAHELDHVRSGKKGSSEYLADLAGIAADLNVSASIDANQDKIDSYKPALGDGRDSATQLENEQLLGQNDKTLGDELAENTDGFDYRQLHPDQIKLLKLHAEDYAKDYAKEKEITKEEALKILARAAVYNLDKGWYDAYNTYLSLDEIKQFDDASKFLQERNGGQIYNISLVERYNRPNNDNGILVDGGVLAGPFRNDDPKSYTDSRLYLDEMLTDADSVQFVLENLALQNPYTYGRTPETALEVQNAKAEGSNQGAGNFILAPWEFAKEGIDKLQDPYGTVLDGFKSIGNGIKAIPSIPEKAKQAYEDFTYIGHEDNLAIMQGKGLEVARNDARSSTELSIVVGLSGLGTGAVANQTGKLVDKIGDGVVSLHTPSNAIKVPNNNQTGAVGNLSDVGNGKLNSIDRAKNTVSNADQPLEPINPNKANKGHGHDEHGYQVTSVQQETRIETGIKPSGITGAPTGKASNFLTPELEAEALGRGRSELNNSIKENNIPKYDTNGEPNRHPVVVDTNNSNGFGERWVRAKDANGRNIRDSNGNFVPIKDPAILKHAKIIYEYVPSQNTWEPVTYYPTE
ncbi:beta strand repeat-containing protein [Psychrobacter alimentarius]|uniref:beta strand repeat-containing protein n=1 Tax=Psychrobacter alimentarius TaxID=261164 RepID=UPI001D11F4E1|nr:S-layer family protein [Psychrobacter alimentarius]